MLNLSLLSFPFPFSLSSKIIATAIFAFALTSCACSDNRKTEADQRSEKNHQEVADAGIIQPSTVSIREAVAEVKAVGKDPAVKGKVTFTRVPEGIKIVADVDGLKPGEHGFHVHEHGDCGGVEAAAAGAHFNPTNKKHGGPDSLERHVGDFGNLVADAKGHAHYERVDNQITFEGANSIIGRSIMVHADRDDLTSQPSGASGARIGCGIIEAVK